MNPIVEEFNSLQKGYLEEIKNDPSNRNYWNSYKSIKKLIANNTSFKNLIDFKIALLSSFTIDPLVPFLDIDTRMLGLYPKIYVAPFNQYQQEILNESSKLHEINPEVIIFFIQLESLLDNMFLPNFPKMGLDEKKNILKSVFSTIKSNLERLMDKSNALILFSNFIVPTFSPLGVLDNKIELGIKEFYAWMNSKLSDLSRKHSSLFILDLNALAGDFGKSKYKDTSMFYRGSILFASQFLPIISYEIMGYIKALKGKNRKALILDLDNTLWGGIIGEDGIEGIKLNTNHPGNEFVDFQKTILSFQNRGIILGINSKNDESYALEVFQKHPAMVLKEQHISVYRINWMDKATNIREIANDLNIGLDSLVFLDDNPVEREMVRTNVPEVFTVEMPKNPALYRQTLEKINDFNILALTTEDLKRGELYHARRKRKDIENSVKSIDDFIKTLEIEVLIREINEFTKPRVSALINKTNQFNLTTIRYTQTEVNEMSQDPKIYAIYTLQVRDKYGDEGIVGVAIIKKEQSKWIIINFLMSCRVIGRKIEIAFLRRIFIDASKVVNRIVGKYMPTKKNSLVKNFFKDNGFSLEKENPDGSSSWIKTISEEDLIYPDLLKIVEE